MCEEKRMYGDQAEDSRGYTEAQAMADQIKLRETTAMLTGGELKAGGGFTRHQLELELNRLTDRIRNVHLALEFLQNKAPSGAQITEGLQALRRLGYIDF